MRLAASCLSLLLLAACTPPVPDSRAGGVGFESYSEYQRHRVASQQARGAQSAPVQTVQSPVQNPAVPFPHTGAPSAAELAAAGVGAQTATGVATQPRAPSPAVTPTPAPAPAPARVATKAAPSGGAGISDEQDFSAVSSRESIASDRARIEENRENYKQIQPTELPQRTRTSGPDIVEYAINAPNRLGEAIYKRSGLKLSRSERACARYDTPEDAQAAFLKAGGPARDRKNLDPDGDGFACYWDPTPFQKVRG